AFRQAAHAERDVEAERAGRHRLHGDHAFALAELHDRALAERALDLPQRGFQRLLPVHVLLPADHAKRDAAHPLPPYPIALPAAATDAEYAHCSHRRKGKVFGTFRGQGPLSALDVDAERPTLPASRRRIARPGVRITPTGETLGARVEGLDLSRPLSPRDLGILLTALARHGVLCFPGQKLTPAALKA